MDDEPRMNFPARHLDLPDLAERFSQTRNVSLAAHMRSTYRNFFPSSARWQFSGIRLARDAG